MSDELIRIHRDQGFPMPPWFEIKIKEAPVKGSQRLIECPPCPYCGERSRLLVSEQGYEAWKAGELIQNALPSLSADEREMLKTGIDPACWDTYIKGGVPS